MLLKPIHDQTGPFLVQRDLKKLIFTSTCSAHRKRPYLILGVAEGAVNKEEAFKREGPGVYSHNFNKLNQSK